MCDDYRYYGNYDKNVKSIKGGGTITPSNPPNKIKRTGVIKDTWNNEITPVPPLFKNVYYSDKNLSNGYLNDDNYVIGTSKISDYYYPSQKMDKVNLIKNSLNPIQKQILNDKNPLDFPPPIINNQQDENEYLNWIENNTIYDGKYIYALEDKPIEFSPNQKLKITNIPYLYNTHNPKSKNQIDNQIDNQMEENFDNLTNTKRINNPNSLNDKTNTMLLIVFSALLIFYFTIYQK